MASWTAQPMTPLDELLRRAKAGDRAAADELFRRVEPQALAMARRKLGDGLRRELESVDVQQSVLGDAFRDLEQCKGETESEFMGWLAGVLENKLRNKVRAATAGKRDAGLLVRLDATRTSSSAELDPSEHAPGPVQRASDRDELERVRAAVRRLPEDWRLVFELRAFEQLDWAVIAERTGQTVKAAQGCYDRARARLAIELGRT